MVNPRRIAPSTLLVLFVLVVLQIINLTTAKDDPVEVCDNPNASENTVEDSIPSLQYSAAQSDNDDGQKATRAKDFEVYFSAYSELHHQKDMLTDTHRMDSYYTAISANAEAVFKDKIVMDVGTGSGILAIWAAKAGAKKVYAIEYTDMARHARNLIKANGFDDIVTVIQGTVEGVKLPLREDGFGDEDNERVVDVIISEWMGYMLIRESMLDSVLAARDRFLKRDTGLMLPSHATILIAPIANESDRLNNKYGYDDAMDEWNEFVERTKEKYGGVDYSSLSEEFDKEQTDYYLRQSLWTELRKEEVLAKPQVLKTLDLMTCSHRDTRGIFDRRDNLFESVEKGNADTNEFDFVMSPKIPAVSGLAGWFTADFKSRTDAMVSADTPKLTKSVTLNTGPERGTTHWGQQVFYFRDALRMTTDLKQASGSLPEDGVCGQTTDVHLKGKLQMFRTKDNTRLYKCRIEHYLEELDRDSQNVIRTTKPIANVYSIP
jgi:protein arginine N-methyltransferase 1